MCQSLEQTVSPGLRRNKPAGLPAVVRSVVLRLLAVAVLSLASNTSFAQSTAPAPACAPYTADYPCAYVGLDSHYLVYVINESTNTVLPGTLDVVFPRGVAITPDNKFAYVAHYSSSAAVIDTASGMIVNDINLGGYVSQIAITPDGAYLWAVLSTQIVRLHIKENPVVSDPISLSLSATTVAFTPDGKSAYVVGICNQTQTTCVERIDTTTLQSDPPIPIPDSISSASDPSVIVTPDGKFACISTSINSGGNLPQEFAVAFLAVGNNPININTVKTGVNANPSRYGLGITPNGTLYAAAPYVGSPSGARTTLNTIFLFDAVSQTYRGTVTVGNAPTGIGVSADGGKVYVTNSADGTVSVIDTQFGTLAKTITVGTSPSAIAAMPSIPPAITTQPADQRIPYRGTATVAIQATGTAPLNYQWYQGTSGDTSNPVQGATGSSFTTPALTTTTAYWVRVSNIVTQLDSTASTVTVSPPVAPTITTQPAAPVIPIGGSTTLAVQASGTLPLSFQWFQGTSGDTSMPQQGAAGPSFITPSLNTSTSYWVRVSNVADSVNSNTVTVSVSPVPQCTLQLQAAGITGPTISAAASCTDVTNPPLPLATTLDWGDQTPPVTVSGGSLTATHTYLSADNYILNVKGVNSLGLEGDKTAYLNLKPLVLNPPLVIFQGQSARFIAGVSSPGPVQVNFECNVIVSSSGVVRKASDLGISCNAMSQPITLSESRSSPTQVTIVIQTTGGALARLSPGDAHRGMLYTCLLPVSGVIVMVGGASSSRRRRKSSRFLAILSMMLLLGPIVSCGGGFTAPKNVQTGTPAGSYQISVVDVLASTSPNTGAFVQTTLIVPLQVVPFQ